QDPTPVETKPPAVTIAPQLAPPGQPEQIGRFQVEEKVGEGVFGRDSKAYDPTLKRTVALKVAKAEQLQSDDMVARFQREAQHAAALQHPHIVPVYDSGTDGPYHYIATGFVPGHSLPHELRQLPEGQTLPLRRAVELVRKLAEALAYAHL